MASIFISHSSRDGEAAAEVRALLRELGHESVFLDFHPEDGIPPGRDWERELYRQIASCQAVVFVCSPHSVESRWCFAELTQAKALGKPIFPVGFAACELPPILAGYQVLDLAADHAEVLARLERGLSTAGLDSASTFAWNRSRPPYPGLAAFQEEDAAVFFGRDREVREALEALARLRRFGGARFVVVLGPSGSGKSSLVRAGIVPRLKRDAAAWLVVPAFRPLDDPFRELAAALARAFAEHGVERDWRELKERLEASAGDESAATPLHEVSRELLLAAQRPDARVLLVVDQAEELLGEQEDGGRFLAFLRRHLVEPEGDVMALATLRSDLLGEFQRQHVLRDWTWEDLRVGPVSPDRYVELIERPAELAGVELEKGLSAAMVADTETEDALPLLAFALRELHERHADDGLLEISEYRDDLGGLEGSIARAAEGVWSALPHVARHEDELRRAFLSLVRVDEEGRYLRQPVARSTLSPAIDEALERFVRARLLVSRDEGEGRALEVAHEALFRSWTRLRTWLDEDRELLLFRRRLAAAVEAHARTGALLSGPDLAEAQSWLARRERDLPTEGAELVRASLLRASRRARRRRLATAGLIVFLAAVATGGTILWRDSDRQRSKAERLTTDVDRERSRAQDLAMAALSRDWLGRDPTTAAGLLAELEDPAACAPSWQPLVDVLQHPLATAVLRGHEEPVEDAIFSPDGTRVLTGSWYDGSVRVWDAVSGDCIDVLRANPYTITSAWFLSGERVALTDQSGSTRAWTPDGPAQLIALEGPGGTPVEAASGSAGGTPVASFFMKSGVHNRVSRDGSVELELDHGVARVVYGGELRYQGGASNGRRACAATLDLDGRHVAVAFTDRTIEVVSLDVATPPRVLRGHTGDVRSVAFSPDGTRLVSASADGTARIWDLARGLVPYVVWEDGPDPLATLGPEGGILVTAARTGRPRVHFLDRAGTPPQLAFDTSGLVLDLALARRAGETTLLTALRPDSDRHAVHVMEHSLETGEVLGRVLLGGHPAAVEQAMLAPVDGGTRIATATERGHVRWWTHSRGADAVDFEDCFAFDPSTGPDQHALVSLDRNGTRVLVSWQDDSNGDGASWVWEPRGGPGGSLESGELAYPRASALSPAGDRAAVATGMGEEVSLWSLGGAGQPAEPVPLPPLKLGTEVNSVRFSPGEGRHVVVGCGGGAARVLAVDGSGDPLVLQGDGGSVSHAEFSLDGEHVLTISADSGVRVWTITPTGLAEALREARPPCLDPDFRQLRLGESREVAEARYRACLESRFEGSR